MKIVVLVLGVSETFLKIDVELNPHVQFYAFDPCPDYLIAHRLQSWKYDNLQYHRQAAWIRNETKTMGLYKGNLQTATLISTKEIRKGEIEANRFKEDNQSWPTLSKLVEVECIDIGEWIKNNLSPYDNNILMADIEGAEYYVLPHLIEVEVMSYFKTIYCEGHRRKMMDNDAMNVIQKKVQIWLSQNGIPWKPIVESLGVIDGN